MAITIEQLVSQFGQEWFALNAPVLNQVLANGHAGDYYGHNYLYGVFGGPNDLRFDHIIPQSPPGLDVDPNSGMLISAYDHEIYSYGDATINLPDKTYFEMVDTGQFRLRQPYLDAYRRLLQNNWVQVRPNPYNGSFLSLGAQGGFRDPRAISWDSQLGLISPKSNYLERDDDMFNTYIGMLIMAGAAAIVAPAIAAQGVTTVSGSAAGASAGGIGVTDAAAGGWISAEGGAGYAAGMAADASELAAIAASAATDAPGIFDAAQLNFSSPDPFEVVANTGTGIDSSVIDFSNIDFISQAAEFNPMDPFTIIQEPMVPWDTGISVNLSSSGSDLLNNKPPTPSSNTSSGSGAANTTPTQPANTISPSKLLNDANAVLGTAGKVVSIIGAGTALKDAQGGKVSTGSGGGSGGGGGGIGYDYNVATNNQTPVYTEPETPINWLLIAAIIGGAYMLTRKDR